MTDLAELPPGANRALDGSLVELAIDGPEIAGMAVVADGPAGLAVVPASAPWLTGQVGPGWGRLSVRLAEVPADVERIRLMTWSSSPTHAFASLVTRFAVDGVPLNQLTYAPDGHRTLEVLELYERYGAWKIRSVLSGWHDHVDTAAARIGVHGPALQAAFATPEPSAPAMPQPTAPAPAASPAVGPPKLAALIEAIAGPGPRQGTTSGNGVWFPLGGADILISLNPGDGVTFLEAGIQVAVGPADDRIGEIALRASGVGVLSSIVVDDDLAYASATLPFFSTEPTTGVLKAVIADLWAVASDFVQRSRAAGLGHELRFAGAPAPRELRPGVGEDLSSPDEWAQPRNRVIDMGALPLPEEPGTLLLLDGTERQITLGAAMLPGVARAWGMVVDRVVRSDCNGSAFTWAAIARLNHSDNPRRWWMYDEPGPGGSPVLMVSLAALQIPRETYSGEFPAMIGLADDTAAELDGRLSELMPSSEWRRNNVPQAPGRAWNGPGTEGLRSDVFVQELAAAAPGASPAPDLVSRVYAQSATRPRPLAAHIAHLATAKAEAPGAPAAWIPVARDLAALAPNNGPGEPCATASLHARIRRLTGE